MGRLVKVFVIQSGLALLGLTACDDNIPNPAVVGGPDGSARDPLEIPWNGQHVCSNAACCPADPACYVSGPTGPGAECLATRDQTGMHDHGHLQFRQTWIYPTSPKGIATPTVYGVLNGQTQLPGCGINGSGGYIQLIDLDLDAGLTRVGWARHAQNVSNPPQADLDEARGPGLCMAQSPADSPGWTDIGPFDDDPARNFSIPATELYQANYPPGLPQPLAQPWVIKPTLAKRVDADFDLAREGGSLHSAKSRSELTEAGQKTRRNLLGQVVGRTDGVTGFYYMDQTNGFVHGFATIAYQVFYDLFGNTPFIVPIREPETFQRVTDPNEQNCIGWFRPGQIPGIDCSAPGNDARDPKTNFFAGVDGKVGLGDGWTKGYFLIVELEQVYVKILNATLCSSYQGANPDPKFTGGGMNKSCRDTGNWNSKDPVNGIPRGDWCSETNGPATDKCHDAFLTIAYHSFAASNVQPTNCDVQGL